MKYRVDNKIYDNIQDVIEEYTVEDFHRDDEAFEEWVNEAYGSIEIAGETYYAYDILSNANDGNLSYLLDDYCENENNNDIEEATYDMEHYSPGDVVYFHGTVIHIIEDDKILDEDQVDIGELRRFLDEQKILKQSEATGMFEEEVMEMFQSVGG